MQQGMRTVGRLRIDNNKPIESNKDSVYRPIVREERKFNKMKIPDKLQSQLPFKSKPKLEKKLNNKNKKGETV